MPTASEFMFFVTQIELSVSEKKEQEGLQVKQISYFYA